METDDIRAELDEIKAALAAQQKMLDSLRASGHVEKSVGHGSGYWKYLLVMSIIVISIGGYGAYQYYLVLQSIIDQTPH
ncbi:hypothetical protein EXS70_03575 [Candidatus Peribacteria bacterium]|nr:hypothetical protein [Candidatus Peribacteria bacterium]